ncbi:hypothetical protein Tco_0105687 [Tanacetum coccineum]
MTELWPSKHDTYKTPIGCTPYKLVYGKACHLPIELEHKAYWALKHANFNLETGGDHRKVQLNELNELRDHAYENSLIYKEKTKRIHDSKIKNRVFNIGDQVLLFNQIEEFSGKLKSRLFRTVNQNPSLSIWHCWSNLKDSGLKFQGTDIAKITRKRSKPDKHGTTRTYRVQQEPEVTSS